MHAVCRRLQRGVQLLKVYDGEKSFDGLSPALKHSLLKTLHVHFDEIDPVELQQSAASILSTTMAQGSSAAEHGLALERSIQNLIKETHVNLKMDGDLSMGLDDFLMGLAGERETAIYLLKQRSEDHG